MISEIRLTWMGSQNINLSVASHALAEVAVHGNQDIHRPGDAPDSPLQEGQPG